MHSGDSIAGNSKKGETYRGQITKTFNSTTESHRRRTIKQLKDHWCLDNKKVTHFNGCYIKIERMRQSGADDNMVMQATKAKYLKDMKHEFKLEHWWEACYRKNLAQSRWAEERAVIKKGFEDICEAALVRVFVG